MCTFCNLGVEGEYHVIIACPIYNDIHRKYLKPYYIRHTSMFKFISAIQSGKKQELVKLAKCLVDAFELRKLSII